MTKNSTVALGAITLLPLLYVLFFLACNLHVLTAFDDAFRGDPSLPRLSVVEPLHSIASIWAVLILLFYFCYVWFADGLSIGKRWLWFGLMLLFNLPVTLVFWYSRLWRQVNIVPTLDARRFPHLVWGAVLAMFVGACFIHVSRVIFRESNVMLAKRHLSSEEDHRRMECLRLLVPDSITRIRVYGGASDRLLTTVTNRRELVEFADACRDIQPFFWNAPEIEVIEEWSVCIDRTNHPQHYEFKVHIVKDPACHVVGLIQERYGNGRSWRYYGHFSSKQMYRWFTTNVKQAGRIGIH